MFLVWADGIRPYFRAGFACPYGLRLAKSVIYLPFGFQCDHLRSTAILAHETSVARA